MTQCFWAATRARTFRVFINHRRRYTTTTTQDDLRQLMVHCAQPVAIITTRLHNSSHFHGATISSFSSIAMHPYPLISFSLQLPSRLASALRPSSTQPTAMKFVVNILSATQANLAKRFAQRDPFQTDVDKELGRTMILTNEGLPLLLGSLGNITCSVVRSIPLDLRDVTDPGHSLGCDEDSNGQPSELFIGRVLRVEQRHYGPVGEQFEEVHTRHEEPVERRPMVYYQKEFLTVQT